MSLRFAITGAMPSTAVLDIRAVASRHNPTTDNTGESPKTLVEYCPDYRSGRGRQSRPDTLCAPLRQAALLHQALSSPAEVAELFTAGIVGLLRRQLWRNALGQTADESQPMAHSCRA